MTDREMLELAARAYGLDGWYVSEEIGDGIVWANQDDCNVWFQPHLSDGDAARLANKLRMILGHSNGYSVARIGSFDSEIHCMEPHGDDVDAAMRRAIVRAAAQYQEKKEAQAARKQEA